MVETEGIVVSDRDVYYSPDEFGLETIGEIQWGEQSYDFDLTVLWKRKSDGDFFMAEDSGCSCPSPFDGINSIDKLTQVTLDGLKTALEGRNGSGGRYSPDQSVDIAELLERAHAAGLR